MVRVLAGVGLGVALYIGVYFVQAVLEGLDFMPKSETVRPTFELAILILLSVLLLRRPQGGGGGNNRIIKPRPGSED